MNGPAGTLVFEQNGVITDIKQSGNVFTVDSRPKYPMVFNFVIFGQDTYMFRIDAYKADGNIHYVQTSLNSRLQKTSRCKGG